MDKLFTGIDWILTIIIIFSSLIFIKAFNTFFHEAGHAIAITFLTKDKVTIFLGSYGDKQKSKKISVGKFEVWIKINILKWKGGLCIPHAINVSKRKVFIYTLAGPIATLFLSVALLAIFLIYRPEGLVAPFLLIFCIYAGLSFFHNVFPRYAAIVVGRGNLIYNDGAKLQSLLDHKKLPQEYNEAIGYFKEGRYDDALAIFEKIIDAGTKNAEIYRLAISAHIKLKNYTVADQLQKKQIAKIGNLNTHDRINLALLKTLTGKYDEAIAYYKHLLQSDKNNKYNLNNLGYTFTLIGNYDDAISYLDKAILIDKDFAYAYSNRAYAKIKLGRLDDGKLDNDYALELDIDNSYAYRNAGIYYFETGKYSEAVVQLNKAKEPSLGTPLMRADIQIVDDYLYNAIRKIEH